jgi:hypothetical protein
MALRRFRVGRRCVAHWDSALRLPPHQYFRRNRSDSSKSTSKIGALFPFPFSKAAPAIARAFSKDDQDFMGSGATPPEMPAPTWSLATSSGLSCMADDAITAAYRALRA